MVRRNKRTRAGAPPELEELVGPPDVNVLVMHIGTVTYVTGVDLREVVGLVGLEPTTKGL